MCHIKSWKRVREALTACAETFVGAGRELVFGRQNDRSVPVRTIPRRPAVPAMRVARFLMNKIIVALIASVALPAWADSGNLELRVNGLQNDQGTVRVALFNTSEAYTKSAEDEGAFQSVEISIQEGVARHVFSGISYGDYAIKSLP